MILRHPYERALVDLCKATQAARYTVYHWLERHYPESAARLQFELREIWKRKRAADRAASNNAFK